MRALIVAGMFLVVCLGVPVAGNAGAPEPAPIHDEIARGSAAAAQCESEAWSTEDYSSCIDAAVGRAMDDDRASMPFQLGVYCSAFFKLALAAGSHVWKQSIVHDDATEAATVDQYDSCVFAAGSIRLEASRICSAIGVPCDAFNRMLRDWRRFSRSDM